MMMMMKTEYDDDLRAAGGGGTGGSTVLRECHTSEEDDTRSSSGGGGGGKKKKLPSKALVVAGGGGDGATIEVVRRPRGRPPGSKNKPKPPIIITREAESAMRPHVLEVPGGQDVIQAVTYYARRKGIGLCILAGSGSVANVTLRQPGPNPGGTVTFHGRFEILSISATFLHPTTALESGAGGNGFSISIAGPQGQIVGGSVVGALLAVGTVVVVAAVFSSPTYHRLPLEEDISGSGELVSEAEGHHQGAGEAAGESCGMSLYSGHLPSDVIWTPTPRPSHPPY